MNEKDYDKSLTDSIDILTSQDILDKYQKIRPATGTPVFEAEEGFDNSDTLRELSVSRITFFL